MNDIDAIVSLENEVIELTRKLTKFANTHEPYKPGQAGYNYAGTLGMNLLTLIRTAKDAIAVTPVNH